MGNNFKQGEIRFFYPRIRMCVFCMRKKKVECCKKIYNGYESGIRNEIMAENCHFRNILNESMGN